MSSLVRFLFWVIVFSFLPDHSNAQALKIPKQFEYPLNIQPRLNANFGEMRPNHFHMGLDLNTQANENLPVFAPADGFVSRVKIESGGFGRAIYLNHPNGLTTVYAHMNMFMPKVEKFLEKKQYEQESWKIDLQMPVGLFKVRKGQIIGYSGNTGASEGPHVHFEIRDTKTENCLNPLMFGLEMQDHVAPDINQLVFYDYDKSIYEQLPVMVGLVKKGNTYYPIKKIELPYEKVMIGIVARDRLDGSANPNGIFRALLLKENKPIAGFKLENISYDFTKNQSGHIDYMLRSEGGPYVQLMHRPKYFPLDIYPNEINQPFLRNENIFSGYAIEVSDVHENLARIEFEVRKSAVPSFNNVAGQKMQLGAKNLLRQDNFQIEFPVDAFYDAVHLQVKTKLPTGENEISSSYETEPSNIPVNNAFVVKIKPNKDFVKIDTARVVMRKIYKSKVEVKKAVFSKDGFLASFKELGMYQLIQDLEPPKIVLGIQNGSTLKAGSIINVSVSDNLKSIRSFVARVDGKWIMFTPRGNQYSYRVDEHFPLGEHLLSIVVYDEAGNQSVQSIKVKRN